MGLFEDIAYYMLYININAALAMKVGPTVEPNIDWPPLLKAADPI